MTTSADQIRAALPRVLAPLASNSQTIEVTGTQKLSGGAIQENWLVTVTGLGSTERQLVLRTDSESLVGSSLSKHDEFAIMKLAFESGVLVPEPIVYCDTDTALGRPFFLMQAIEGIALGQKVARDPALQGDKATLLSSLTAQLAKIHAIRPNAEVSAILGAPPDNLVASIIAEYREMLDGVSRASPIIELALRRLELAPPDIREITFCHRDFRTGNYMVKDGQLTGILDWEFAGWSDPREELGWFCSRTWRFGADDYPAGGLASREELLSSYTSASGRHVSRRELDWWELLANIRWAVIAHQQADRLLRGGERSLELGLIGRRIHETEHEILLRLAHFERTAA